MVDKLRDIFFEELHWNNGDIDQVIKPEPILRYVCKRIQRSRSGLTGRMAFCIGQPAPRCILNLGAAHAPQLIQLHEAIHVQQQTRDSSDSCFANPLFE
jgi:hypothetical protein